MKWSRIAKGAAVVTEIKILHIGKEEPKESGRPYIVSREGRFGRVIKGGKIKVGDAVYIVSLLDRDIVVNI